jgi:hypothetical protein
MELLKYQAASQPIYQRDNLRHSCLGLLEAVQIYIGFLRNSTGALSLLITLSAFPTNLNKSFLAVLLHVLQTLTLRLQFLK